MTQQQIISEILQEFENSELNKRISVVESMAQIHGTPPYTGQAIQQFLTQSLERISKESVESDRAELVKKITQIIPMNRDLFELGSEFTTPRDTWNRAQAEALTEVINLIKQSK